MSGKAGKNPLTEIRKALESKLKRVTKENGFFNDLKVYGQGEAFPYVDGFTGQHDAAPFALVIPEGGDFIGTIGPEDLQIKAQAVIYYGAPVFDTRDEGVESWENLTADILRAFYPEKGRFAPNSVNTGAYFIEGGIAAPARDKGANLIAGSIQVAANLTIKTI